MLSTIIVTKNDIVRLNKTLSSIASQKDIPHSRWEVILIDGSDEIDQSLKAQILPNGIEINYFHVSDRGIYDAMNIGIGKLRTQFAHFLNCGDTFHHNQVIAETLVSMERSPASKLFAWDFSYSGVGKFSLKGLDLKQILRGKIPYCHQAQIVHTSLLKNYGFDLDLGLCADYLLTLNLLTREEFFVLDVLGIDYEGMGATHNQKSRIFREKRLAIVKWILLNRFHNISLGFFCSAIFWNMDPLVTRILRKISK